MALEKKKHSTELATTELIDRVISALDEKSLPIPVFMYLSKAFDTLDHQTLLNKLQYCWIRSAPLTEWTIIYLIGSSI